MLWVSQYLELTFMSVIFSSTKCVPLEHKSQPFIVVAAQSGNPFLEPVDNIAEASFVESVHVVTPSNFIPFTENKSSQLKVIKDESVRLSSEEEEIKETKDISLESEEILIKDFTHWTTLSSFQLSDGLKVTKYRSNLTGLTVVLASADSPIVNGYFCLATEAMDNDGLPHTLEHLIFLGSEDYPYKEVLDLLANRALADRTNAWTDTDHTCYTVYTAGPSGFLHILPVYLDHILYPTLREEDYRTEVHHINGEGQDAGVVYSEMQGVEQSTSNIMYFSLAEKLYPGSGYFYEAGGYLQNLRNSTSIEKVRDYHKKFYRTENLVLTITGRMDEEELFETLRKTEEKVLRKRQHEGCEEFTRPWQNPLKKLNLTEDLIYEIEYPSEDESLGSIAIAWRLNETISENIEMLEAYKLLMKYLTVTQVSPLEVAFVENGDPLSTGVSSETLEVQEPAILMEFENVPVERIDEVIPKLEKVLNDIVRDGPESFDLERITNFIEQEIINNLKEIENSPHLFVPDASVLDMLYGESEEDLKKFVTSSQANKKYLEKDSQYWIDLIRDQLIRSPKIVLKGKPSKRRSQELSEKEEKRLEEQIEELGPEGLEEMQSLLDAAIDSQHLPGKDVLTEIPLGNADTIKFRSFDTLNSTNNPSNTIRFQEIPFKIQVENVMSNFVQFYLFFKTDSLSSSQRELLPLLLDLWMSSPLLKDGVVTDIETVVKRSTKTFLSIDHSLGFTGDAFSPGAFSDTLVIEAQCEMDKFGDAVEYLRDVINYPYFTSVKVNTTAANLLNNIPSLKLSATDVLRALHDGVYFNKDNNIHDTNFIKQKTVLEDVMEKLKTESQDIINYLYNITKSLATQDKSFIYIASNVQNLTQQYGSDLALLKNLLNQTEDGVDKESLKERFVALSEHAYRDNTWEKPQHIAFAVGGTESCYLKQSVQYNNTDWSQPNTAAERVMLQYLSDRMYDEVRGPGLTYGVSMSLSITEGRSSLSLTRSSRLVEAYQTVKEIIERYVGNEDAWDEDLAASAKGSLIYSWTEKEETVGDLIEQTVKAYLRQTDSHYNRNYVKSLGKVTLAEIKQAAQTILPLFLSSETSQTVIVCPPSSLDDIVESFKENGLSLTKISSLEETFLN